MKKSETQLNLRDPPFSPSLSRVLFSCGFGRVSYRWSRERFFDRIGFGVRFAPVSRFSRINKLFVSMFR